MDTTLKYLSVVLGMMLHNAPLLEAVVIAPLLLKKYLWALLACLLVTLGTFGVELHNNYDLAVWASGENLAILATQIAIAIGVSGLIFLAKIRILPMFGVGGSKSSKREIESSK